MINIGTWLTDIFGHSELGTILLIFVVFLLDAFLLPMVPELFFAVGCISNSMLFGVELLATAILAEIVGITSLYLLVSHIRVPARIEKIAKKYTDFLVLGDERLLLLNRVAPMIPFAGAFIAILKWDLKKSLMYVVIGCVIKYGLIVLMSETFKMYFESDMATTVMLVFIFAVIIISFIFSIIMKKRKGLST